jgi:cell wall-associated NlpC family hydrolase
MTTREQVIAEARSWVGTPFAHQQEAKGLACDCIGLLRGVCINLGLFPADWQAMPEAAPFVGYCRMPDGVSLRLACDTFMTEVPREAMQPGDAVLVRFDAAPQHVGIVTPYPHGNAFGFVQAVPRGVIETRLMFGSTPRTMKFVAAYRLPGVQA